MSDFTRITYQDIADATGISWSAIERYANGRAKYPDPEYVKRIADYFGVGMDYFVEDDENEGNKKRTTSMIEIVHYPA